MDLTKSNILYLGKAKPSGGGSGGTLDYEDLENKPQINNVELNGNKTQQDLKLDTLPSGNTLPSGVYVGQLFLYNGNEIDKGLYRYNGNLWELELDKTDLTNYYNKTEIDNLLEDKENLSNKVSSWSATTSNDKYPSEKLVKDSLDNKADDIDNGSTNVDRATIIKLVRPGHMTTIKAYLTQAESPTGNAGAFHFIGYRFTEGAGWLIATRYTTDMWICKYSSNTFTDWKQLNIEDSSNVRFYDTGSTATTRATIMNKLTKDYTMMIANVYFSAAESPNGNAGYWLCEVYRYNNQIGYIKATNFGKDVFICNKLSGSFNAWSRIAKTTVTLTTSNYKTELSTANTNVGDEICYNYVNGSTVNSASGHFVRIRGSASQWSGVARVYIDSKYYLAFSLSVLSSGNIQLSYIDDDRALKTVEYAPSSAGEWILIKH